MDNFNKTMFWSLIYTRLKRGSVYIGPNFEHIFMDIFRSLTCRLSNNVYCTEVSEVMREIFRYVTHK